MRYTLYIDEVGNPSLRCLGSPNERYLSLTGVIIERDYVKYTLAPSFDALKTRYFPDHHPDSPLTLHRKKIVNKNPPFTVLRDVQVRQRFNTDLLRLLTDLEFVAITVVIDKLAHRLKYYLAKHPYHYCLMVLVERYVQWLQGIDAIGDVMAESRAQKDDRALKQNFERLFSLGTSFVSPAAFQQRITSNKLKLKTKDHNIAGLQLADLIAHPSFASTVARRKGHELPGNFGGTISRILENSKYYRSVSGKLEGYGRKWLP